MKDLNYIEKKNPFRVPENYFEDINSKIISATSGFEDEKPRTGIVRRLRPLLAAAAAVAFLAVIGYTAFYFIESNRESLKFPEMAISDLPDSYLNDIDILTLEENVAANGIFREESGVNNDDIIDYLVLENIDIYDIYEQL